jgi:ferredoxin
MKATKSEKEYLEIINDFNGNAFFPNINSVQEGFEYFDSSEYLLKSNGSKNPIVNKLKAMDIKNAFHMIGYMGKYVKSIMTNISEGYNQAKDYMKSTTNHTTINEVKWQELKDYAWDNWKVKIGFTKVPEEYIFEGKAILFKYAIVCIQEMNKTNIDKAPSIEAGGEVMKVYNSLGIAANDISNFLNNRGYKTYANHPLGGLVDTTPLADKAGLGCIGHNGLLINEEFGSRCRIAPIFIEEKAFDYTDSNRHDWVHDFCMNCRRCEKSCVTGAILHDEIKVSDKIDAHKDRYRTIDREKCFPFFNKALGCSVCIKVCPFSNPEAYKKLEKAHIIKVGREV